MMNTRLAYFIGGNTGPWRIREIQTIIGLPLPHADRLALSIEPPTTPCPWVLRGVRSNERYTTAEEKSHLEAKQEGLGRPDSTRAALIPIKKKTEWWLLSQDQRRAIFKEQSQHTSIGLRYLPSIARRLHHCRDLGTDEPFDFLTWFEFRPEDEPAFDELLGLMRQSREWEFIEREVDIRLSLDAV